jgi:SynChlorMet cassette protein ScmD
MPFSTVETFNCQIEPIPVNMETSNRPIANPSIVLREEFDKWAFLFDPDSAQVIVINPTGVVVWKSMNGKNSREDILRNVAQCFSDVSEDAIEHVDAFIKDLEERGLVGYEIES